MRSSAGFSPSGSSSCSDGQGDLGGAGRGKGAGQSAIILPAGGIYICDGDEYAQGECTRVLLVTDWGGSTLDGPDDGVVEEVVDMDAGPSEGSVDGEA